MSWRSLALAPKLKFVSGGPNNYASSVFSNSTGKRRLNAKGITLNYDNSKVVNFTVLRNMILEDGTPLH